jgi:hypothetical protein
MPKPFLASRGNKFLMDTPYAFFFVDINCIWAFKMKTSMKRLVGYYYYYINTNIHCVVMMYNTKHDMMYVSTVASWIHNAKGKILRSKSLVPIKLLLYQFLEVFRVYGTHIYTQRVSWDFILFYFIFFLLHVRLMAARSWEFPRITTLGVGGQLFRELPAPQGVTLLHLKILIPAS